MEHFISVKTREKGENRDFITRYHCFLMKFFGYVNKLILREVFYKILSDFFEEE
jgi:hypothetical protein